MSRRRHIKAFVCRTVGSGVPQLAFRRFVRITDYPEVICKVCAIKLSHSRGSLHEVRGAFLMKITSITTVLILTFAGIAGLPWPGTEGFALSCSAQSMVKDFEQSHLIPPKMQTKLEISRQAELFPSSGFFQPRKVVLFCAIVRVAAE